MIVNCVTNILSNAWGIYVMCLWAYLCGSISGSMLLGSLKGIDIRKKGSGNAGATNAFRTVGPFFALSVMTIDILKGFLPVFILYLSIQTINYFVIIVAISAIFGHVYPIYYGFKGGKGAGTLVGVILALFPQCFIYVLLIWLSVLILTGYVGLSSILAGISFVVIAFLQYQLPDTVSFVETPFGQFTIFVSLFLIFTHRDNIKRMLAGKENQFTKVMIFKK